MSDIDYKTQYCFQEEDFARRPLQDLMEYLLESETHNYIIETDLDIVHVPVRFSTDGAKMAKKKDSVRAVIKILSPRDSQNLNQHASQETPDDEVVLYMYMGKY